MIINVNQDGEYTKHYYADALRIASKLGTGFSGNLCDSTTVIENTYPGYLSNRMTIQYDEIREEINETSEIGDDLNDIYGIPYPNFCNLSGNQAQETDIFYYHPDHLGSTGMVTDNNANITQGFLYAPFGEIVNEYNPGWQSGVIPKNSYNAKELDEENGMYYYSARYYAPPTFISRDPKFEEYPSISPYTYCANNPVMFVDPTGETLDVPEGDSRTDVAKIVNDENKGYIKYNGNTMYLDFGEMSKENIDKTLANDEGLNLLNNMINAKNSDGSDQKYLYETTDSRTVVTTDGSTYITNVGKPAGTVTYNDNSFATNLSKTPHGVPGQMDLYPEAGYDGTVRISQGTMFTTYNNNYIADILVFRGDLIFHELNENYLRTNKGMSYKEAHSQAGGCGLYTRFMWGK